MPDCGDDDRVVNGCGDASVIAGVRIVVKHRARIGVQLMDEASRLLVSPIVNLLSLRFWQFRKGTAHHGRAQ